MKKLIDLPFFFISICCIINMIAGVIDSSIPLFCGWFCAYGYYILMRLEILDNKELKNLILELHNKILRLHMMKEIDDETTKTK